MGVRRRLGLLLLYTLVVGCWCPGAGQQLTSLLLGQSPALLLYHTFLSNLNFFLNKDTSLEALLIGQFLPTKLSRPSSHPVGAERQGWSQLGISHPEPKHRHTS